MQAIDTQDNQFHDGNGTTELGTILPAWWLNQIQAEILAVLAAGKVVPNKAHTNQMLNAINKLIAGAVVNNLTSSNADKPLSALQGKVLSEQIAAAVSGSFNLRGQLTTQNLNDLHGSDNYGVWQNTGNVNATFERNYPVLKAGTLLVLPSAYRGQQIYVPFDSKSIFIRDTRDFRTPQTWGEWYELSAAVNVLNSTSTTSPLSAAMGKKLNDEKLGNSGTQTLAGVLNINNPNQWAAMHFQTKSGYWRFETNPTGDSASNGMRFNYVFTGADNTEKSRIAFPESVGTSTVAYQGWVSEQIQNAKPSNFGGIDLDTATTPQFFINARSANPLPVAGDWAGLVIGYSNDSTQIIAAAGNLWVRGSDNNPISDPSHWSEWRRLLDETNGVTLSGNQTIAGIKTFANNIYANSEIHAGGLIATSYRNDWVGFMAKQPTEGKSGFFDVTVNNVIRGGLQIATESDNRYFARLMVTPAGATNADRRVAGMTVYDTAIHTYAYGWLHEGFVRAGNGIGQNAGHQVKIGWNGRDRLKATIDNTDLGNIVFDQQLNTKSTVAVLTGKIAHGATIPLPSGFSQAQCKWIVSMHNDNPTSVAWDLQEAGAHNHYATNVWTDANRVVHCRVYRNGTGGATGWNNAEANYMIIGVK